MTQSISAFDSRAAFPDDSHEGYGGAIFGYFIPDITGPYYFHLKSDDPGQFFINPNGPAFPDITTDADGDLRPDNVNAIQTGCCNDFTAPPSAFTAGPYTLTAGQKYGMVGLYHEGGGGDYLQIAFTRDGNVSKLDQTDNRNFSTIPGQYLGSVTPVPGPDLAIGQQPQDIHVEDKRTGAFTLTTTAAPGITYQWQTAPAGSSTFTDIAGATGSSLTVTANLTSNNNTQYRVKLHAEGQDITSSAAKLIV